MALIQCKECGRDISDQADACPSCGAPVKPSIWVGRRGDSSTSTGCVAGCLIVIVLLVLAASISQCSGSGGGAPGAKPTASPSPSAAELADTTRMKMGAIAVASLKSALRDPDSLVVESVLVSDDGKYSCVSYRAKNGFGGYNRDHVVYTVAGGDQSIRGWNKHCAGKRLNDVTTVATELAKRVAP